MKGITMTRKDYIKFAKVFKKAIESNNEEKEMLNMVNFSNHTDNIIGDMIDETIKIFESDNSLFDEGRFRDAITNSK